MLGICAVLMLVSLAGCATKNEEVVNDEVVVDETPEAPSVNAKVKAPDVIGDVLEVKEDGKLILISSKDAVVNGDIWITIEEETNFFENLSKDIAIGYRDVSRDFEVGNHVEIILDGLVMESYPMQATASAVAVNEKQ